MLLRSVIYGNAVIPARLNSLLEGTSEYSKDVPPSGRLRAKGELPCNPGVCAGLASSADIEELYVQKQLGHASAEMIRKYQRWRDPFRNQPHQGVRTVERPPPLSAPSVRGSLVGRGSVTVFRR